LMRAMKVISLYYYVLPDFASFVEVMISPWLCVIGSKAWQGEPCQKAEGCGSSSFCNHARNDRVPEGEAGGSCVELLLAKRVSERVCLYTF
jgi:hypothetical protein